jgi:hypothetical protein
MKIREAFGIAVLLICSFVARAEAQSPREGGPGVHSVANDNLRKWIENDLHFFPNERGIPKLFLRRQPVRVGIPADPFPIKDEVGNLIARLSDAVGISYEISMRDVNLAIVVDSPISDGDKPDVGLWKRIGLSQSMYEIVSGQAKWSSGCGIYSFTNKGGGEVPLSIVFADSKLKPAQIRDCVIEGVLRAFGLRVHRTQILRADDGYLQYVTLAKALSVCEKKVGIEHLLSMSESDQRSSYSECASEIMEKR